jgi:glutamate 5-kinase
MADHLHTAGKVVLDAGAVQKLTGEGKSLLPIGVIEVRGEFGRGAVITCIGEDGVALARGISNYTSRKRGASCASRRRRSRRCWASWKGRS